jgi:hypothetical protein
MAKRIQISEQIKGALRQNESWWTLILEDDGTKSMEHEWSYVDPFGKNPGSEGKEIIPVEAFLADDHPEALKAKVRAAIK